MRAALVLLVASAIVAPATTVALTPPQSSSQDPIAVKECRVPSAGLLGRSVAAKMGAVELIFANASDKEIIAVRFRFAISAQLRDDRASGTGPDEGCLGYSGSYDEGDHRRSVHPVLEDMQREAVDSVSAALSMAQREALGA